MRTVKQCLRLKSSRSMTKEERANVRVWLDSYHTRMTTDPFDYCCMLGWFVLDQDIPLSPKEAGFD